LTSSWAERSPQEISPPRLDVLSAQSIFIDLLNSYNKSSTISLDEKTFSNLICTINKTGQSKVLDWILANQPQLLNNRYTDGLNIAHFAARGGISMF